VMGCGYRPAGEEPYSLVYLRDTNWVIGFNANRAKGSMVSVSGDGSAFASGGYESTEWRNFNSGSFSYSPNYVMNDFTRAEQVGVSLSRDGKTMATASGSDSAVWTLRGSKWENSGRRVHDGLLFSISLSDDGTVIAVGVEGSVPRIEIYQRRD
jgi:hypothetical protein